MKHFLPSVLMLLAETSAVGGDELHGVSTEQNADATSYKLSGNRSVRPSLIYDDGVHTYIKWDQSQSIPAVFGVDEKGRELTVNGFMRDGSFIIDRVYTRLVFRIDDASASARRKSSRQK